MGVTRTSDDEIHFFANDEDLGLAFLVGPHMQVWAVVELETDALEITRPPYGKTC